MNDPNQNHAREVVYFSQRCEHSRALLEKLKERADLLARLQCVDCTNVESHNGSTFFAVQEDGHRHEIPMLITNVPALDFIVPAGAKYKRPLVGLEKIATHLRLNEHLRPSHLQPPPPPPPSSSGVDAAADTPPLVVPPPPPRAAGGPPPAPRAGASFLDRANGAGAAFVPSAPAASLARP